MARGAMDRGGWAACAAIALAAAALIPFYRYEIFEDGVSYLSIAQAYARGDFSHAVNGFWSPLYSWLLAVPLAMGIEPLTAAKTLTPLIALAAMGASWRLAVNLGVNRLGRAIAAGALAPILLFFGLSVTTPDLLAAAILLFYLTLVTGAEPFNKPGRAIAIGLLGAAAYLAKTYAMWFFLPHALLAGMMEVRRRSGGRQRALWGWGMAMGVFALAIAPWVGVISHHYGYFTLGNAGAYNIAFDGPESSGDPIRNGGLFPLPRPAAVSAWDDPTYFPPPRWNPLGGWKSLRYLIWLAGRNAEQSALIIQWAAPFACIAGAGAIVWWLARRPTSASRPVWIAAAAALIYPWGYLLTHVLLRFLSFELILLLLLSVRALQQLGGRRATLLITLLAFGFAWRSAAKLYEIRGEGMQNLSESAELGPIPAGSAVASDGFWDTTLFYCFHRRLHYLGTVNAGMEPTMLREELRKFGVDYLVIYHTDADLPLEKTWQRVNPESNGVLIYRVP